MVSNAWHELLGDPGRGMGRLFTYATLIVAVLGAAAIACPARAGTPAGVLSAHAPQALFDVADAPTAPDYNEKSAWAADGGDAGAGPLGVREDYPESRKADVFFIHPTSYFSTEHWNPPMTPRPTRERIPAPSAIRRVSSIFAVGFMRLATGK